MAKVTVEVEVHLEEVGSAIAGQDAPGFRFVQLKIGDAPPIPLPNDKPAPRRLRRELAAAAALALGNTALPASPPAPSEP